MTYFVKTKARADRPLWMPQQLPEAADKVFKAEHAKRMAPPETPAATEVPAVSGWHDDNLND